MPSLHYQGPKYFQEEVVVVFDKIKDFLTREDDLQLLVGGIERIILARNKIQIIGDAKTNASIDRAFEAMIVADAYEEDPEWNIDAAKIWARELYKAAQILPEEQRPIEYNPLLDVVLLNPEPLFEYILSKSISPEYAFATEDPQYIEEYIIRACYPIHLVQALALWDFGDTSPHLELQYHFRQQGFSYDKAKDGRFSYRNFFKQKLEKKENVAAYGQAMNISQKTRQLRLYELESYAALALTRAKMLLPPEVEEIVIIEKTENPLIEQLLALVDNDFSQLLPFMKEKIEEAYAEERSVFQVLGIES